MAAVAIAGCGGGGKSNSSGDFKKQFAPLDSQLKDVGRRVGTTITTAKGKTDAQLATELSGESTDLGSVVGKMRGLKPPDKAKKDYQELESELTQVHTDLSQLTTIARTHKASQARTLGARLVTDIQPIKDTANRVRRAVGLPQSP